MIHQINNMAKLWFDLRKLTNRKIVYVIALTSVFWFSMNILLLIANTQAARESLDSLGLTSHEHSDSHFMKHAKVLPLAPHKVLSHRDLPWLKKEFFDDKIKASPVTLNVPGRRGVYDASSNVNKNPTGKGEMGVAAFLDTEEEKKYAEAIFANHSFNSVLSDKISLDRTMKDVRGQE